MHRQQLWVNTGRSNFHGCFTYSELSSLIARFMGPTWGLPGADRTEVGPLLVPWTLLFGMSLSHFVPFVVTNKPYESWEFMMTSSNGNIFRVNAIGFRSRFSQCVDYIRFNEKSFCFRWQETTKLMLFSNTQTSSLVILCDLRYLTGNISSVMTKHMGVQRKLHRFAYLIVQII